MYVRVFMFRIIFHLFAGDALPTLLKHAHTLLKNKEGCLPELD